jgi:hypothetical protein
MDQVELHSWSADFLGQLGTDTAQTMYENINSKTVLQVGQAVDSSGGYMEVAPIHVEEAAEAAHAASDHHPLHFKAAAAAVVAGVRIMDQTQLAEFAGSFLGKIGQDTASSMYQNLTTTSTIQVEQLHNPSAPTAPAAPAPAPTEAPLAYPAEEFVELSATAATAKMVERDGSLRIGFDFGGGGDDAAAAEDAQIAGGPMPRRGSFEGTGFNSTGSEQFVERSSAESFEARRSRHTGLGTSKSVRGLMQPIGDLAEEMAPAAPGNEEEVEEKWVEVAPRERTSDGSLRIGFGSGSMSSNNGSINDSGAGGGGGGVGSVLKRDGSLSVGFGSASEPVASSPIRLAAKAAAAADYPAGMLTTPSVSGWMLGDRCEAVHHGDAQMVTIVGWLLDDDGDEDDIAVVRTDQSGKVIKVLMSALMEIASEA